jgi:hypothetical protein
MTACYRACISAAVPPAATEGGLGAVQTPVQRAGGPTTRKSASPAQHHHSSSSGSAGCGSGRSLREGGSISVTLHASSSDRAAAAVFLPCDADRFSFTAGAH